MSLKTLDDLASLIYEKIVKETENRSEGLYVIALINDYLANEKLDWFIDERLRELNILTPEMERELEKEY